MHQRTHLLHWLRALTWASVVMSVILAVAVLGNIAIGRVIHWEIVTAIGPIGLGVLTYLKGHSA